MKKVQLGFMRPIAAAIALFAAGATALSASARTMTMTVNRAGGEVASLDFTFDNTGAGETLQSIVDGFKANGYPDSAEGAWRRIDYPDYTRRWPQMKGAVLGASGENEFVTLRNAGATLARYRMETNWDRLADASACNAWLDGHLAHIDEMLPLARRNGIKICVSLCVSAKEKNGDTPTFAVKRYEDALVSAWEKIAKRLKGKESSIYGYDLLEKPDDGRAKLAKESWRRVFGRTIEAIRAIDPITPIVAEPTCQASPRGFDTRTQDGGKGFEPLPYDNVIYSVQIERQAKDAAIDIESLRKELMSVRFLQLKTGARIYVGEFLAADDAPNAAQYLNNIGSLFLEFGWDWTYGSPIDSFSGQCLPVLKRFFNDDRIQGFVADKIKYPDRLSPGKRFRGACVTYPNHRETLAEAKALGMNLIRTGFWIWTRDRAWPRDANGRDMDTNDETLATFIANCDKKIEYLKETLDRAQSLGMKVAICGTRAGQCTTREGPGEDPYFQDPELIATMVSFWHKLARSLKGHPALYGYDIVNEPLNREFPMTRIHHREFMILCARAIRDEDPDATLIVECNAHGSPAGFDCKSRYGFVAMTPIPFDNVIYSVHVYQPIGFTHQGIGKKKDEYLHHSYPTTQAKLDENRQRFPGDLGKDTGKPEDWNKDYIRNAIKSVREFQLKYGARIYVGEFSAAAWTDGGDRYLQDVTDLFEAYGWDYTYHAFRENYIWSLEHEGEENASLRKAKEETPRMKVMKAKWALNKKIKARRNSR